MAYRRYGGYKAQRPPTEFERMRQDVLSRLETDEFIEALYDSVTRHHAMRHHLSGFDGAFAGSMDGGVRRSKVDGHRVSRDAKTESSYFLDKDAALDAIYMTLRWGRTSKGKRNIDALTGFLLRDDLGEGERLHLRLRPDPMKSDEAFGKTILREPGTPTGAQGRITEVEATDVKIIIEKGAGRGDFTVYNIYPVCSDEDLRGRGHQTRPDVLREKMIATDTFGLLPPVRKLETLMRTMQDDTTPSVTVRDAKTEIDLAVFGGPVVRLAPDEMTTDESETSDDTIRELSHLGFEEHAHVLARMSHEMAEDSPTFRETIPEFYQARRILPTTLPDGPDKSQGINLEELAAALARSGMRVTVSDRRPPKGSPKPPVTADEDLLDMDRTDIGD